MDYSENNILTKAAILIIYEDGTYTLVPKMKGYDYHIYYIDYEIKNNNEILKDILKPCDIKSALKNPSEISIIINEINRNGNILLTNFACNYMGQTNYFGAYLPKILSEKQKDTIKELEEYIKELEFAHICQYNLEYERTKTTNSVDLLEFIEKEMKI